VFVCLKNFISMKFFYCFCEKKSKLASKVIPKNVDFDRYKGVGMNHSFFSFLRRDGTNVNGKMSIVFSSR